MILNSLVFISLQLTIKRPQQIDSRARNGGLASRPKGDNEANLPKRHIGYTPIEETDGKYDNMMLYSGIITLLESNKGTKIAHIRCQLRATQRGLLN